MQSPVEARIDEVDRRVAELGRTVDQRFDGLNHSIEQVGLLSTATASHPTNAASSMHLYQWLIDATD